MILLNHTRARQDVFQLELPPGLLIFALRYYQALERGSKHRKALNIWNSQPAVSYLPFFLELKDANPSSVP